MRLRSCIFYDHIPLIFASSCIKLLDEDNILMKKIGTADNPEYVDQDGIWSQLSTL